MKVLLVILASYSSATIATMALLAAYRMKSVQPYIISDDPHRSTTDRELYLRAVLNSVVSVVVIFAVMYGLGDYLYYDHAAPIWRYLLEMVTVVLIYDFAYYFVHRYPFHEWKILRAVHAVHHAARNPRVIDSLLLHPLETILGLLLFFASVAVVGGVHIYTLAVLFTTYTAFNVLNHAGIDIPHFPLKTLGVMASKHDKHHHSLLHGNYASITPLPDLIFNTVE